MSDDQGKELSPAFAEISPEEKVPVPIEARVVILPPIPPSSPAEVRGLADFEAQPSQRASVKPTENESCFIDDRELGFSIEVEESERESEGESESKKQDESESGREESEPGPSGVVARRAAQAQSQPWPGEEEIHGILHLYKTSRKAARKEKVKYSSTLGILNIPTTVTRSHLHNFLAPFQEAIYDVKIIKDSTLGHYMALIKFTAKDIADTFYMVYNGCSFNERDIEACHLVYVGRFEVLKYGGRASFPMKNLTELPRCTVCLERVGDSVRGILTWLCDQSFEGQSYQSPSSMVCPVCSYCDMPQEEPVTCLGCGVRENLHICLICGFVGCGQDMRGHADKHFDETKHAYAMQLNDHRVWDYVENNYVQSDTQQGPTDVAGQCEKEADEEKYRSLQLEYSYLLSSQLETQRLFWEQKMIQLEKDAHAEIIRTKAKLASTIDKCSKLECEINDLQKEKRAVEEKCTDLNTKVAKLSSELKEEQEINKSLRANQILLQNQVKEEENVLKVTCEQIDLQITGIQEQLQDIIIYLETQQKANDSSAEPMEEGQEGQINTDSAAPESSSKEEEL